MKNTSQSIGVLVLLIFLTTTNANFVKAQDHSAALTKPKTDAESLIGRWDIDVTDNGKILPSWLEVEQSGFKTLIGRYVATSGSARPISKIHFENGKFNFSIPPQWEDGDGDFTVEGELSNEQIKGEITSSNGKKYSFAGNKAPALLGKKDITWGKSEKIFNGKDLTGWKAFGAPNQWIVKDGVLTSPKSGANIVTDKKFKDFKLEIEFRYPEGSNSGVYLRGRYEVQVMDTPKGKHPNSHDFGGVYGFLTPSEIPTLGPGEWQKFEITLVGRMVTIVANGTTIIQNQEIPGITGGALDSKEGEPGPIYIQGDHGPVEYRNIVITEAK